MSSMLSRHDSGGRERAHLRDPAFLERARTRFEGRTRRAHVIDQQHGFPDEPTGGPRQPKGAAHVPVATPGRQAGLRRGRADASQSRVDRNVQPPGQIVGLVEPALPSSRRVERHGDGGVDPVEKIPASIAHQCGQRPGKRSVPVVLQRVDDGSKRPLVRADRAGSVDVPARAPASGAPGQRHADCSPRRQGIAATIAEWRGQRQNRSPAGRAHGPAGRVIKGRATGRARGREQNGQQGVAELYARYSQP